MSDHKRSPSPPPGYTSSENLRTTSHGYTLNILSRPPFHPGSTIDFSIVGHSSASSHEDAMCVLEGMTCCEIMGKMRYQVRSIINTITETKMGQIAAGPGFMGGPGALITAHEDHVFASASTSVSLHSKGETQGQIAIPIAKTCNCRQGGLMPSVPIKESNDKSWIRWRVKVYIKRKGLLKRDAKWV